ncbi:Ubiquitin conjugating enzyme E2 B [Diplonema papillatum]|nr:Ubiquitin conjugating enzyme E2 B [Diplonema papillatum]
MAAEKRLLKELRESRSEPDEAIAIVATEEDIRNWEARIQGPEGSPYQGGVFVVSIEVPPDYPFKMPSFRFKTRVYHPSITKETGEVCEEALGCWKPSIKIIDVLRQLRELLNSPRPENPVEPEIAHQLSTDKAAFDREAVSWTKTHAG